MRRAPRVRVQSHVRGLDPRTIRRRARTMLQAAKRTDRELSILLCGTAEMTTLHEAWLGERGPTDVLSFPQRDGPLGDVVLCVPVLRANARRYGWTLLVEATRMLAHGILHLCGRDHRTPAEERRMDREARALVAAVEKGRPNRRSARG